MNHHHEYLHLILNAALNGLWNAIEGEINHLCPNVQSISRDMSIKSNLAYQLFFLWYVNINHRHHIKACGMGFPFAKIGGYPVCPYITGQIGYSVIKV